MELSEPNQARHQQSKVEKSLLLERFEVTIQLMLSHVPFSEYTHIHTDESIHDG